MIYLKCEQTMESISKIKMFVLATILTFTLGSGVFFDPREIQGHPEVATDY